MIENKSSARFTSQNRTEKLARQSISSSFLKPSGAINRPSLPSPKQKTRQLCRPPLHPNSLLTAVSVELSAPPKLSTLHGNLKPPLQKKVSEDSNKLLPKSKHNLSLEESASSGSLGRSRTEKYNEIEERHEKLQGIIRQIKQRYSREEKQPLIPALKVEEMTKDTSLASERLKTQPTPRSSLFDQIPIYSSVERKHIQCPRNDYYVKRLADSLAMFGVNAAKEHLINSMRQLNLVKTTGKPSLRDLEDKKVVLARQPKNKGKKTLVMDLDETLCHCGISSVSSPVSIKVNSPNGKQSIVRVNIRPYAKEFLQKASILYEIVIFTSGSPGYADPIINYLDPQSKYISHRLYRDHCWLTEEGQLVKDLRIIANRQLSDLALVDNSAVSYAFQLSNGIPIIPFYNNQNDTQLKELLGYLEQLAWVEDIRVMNQSQFKLLKYYAFFQPEDLIEGLYRQQ